MPEASFSSNSRGSGRSLTLTPCVADVAFRWLIPEEGFPITYRRRGNAAHLDLGGERGKAIVRAMADQIGLTVIEVKEFGLEGSGGSSPLRMTVQDGSRVFGKIYSTSHERADRWYRFGCTILYGQLEDETAIGSVRRLAAYEDYALRLLADYGVRVARTYGLVELTPNQEYMLATEFFENARNLGDSEIDDMVIDEGLGMVRTFWDIGVAHRDIKPANLLVRDGKLYLIDVFFAEIHPSPWRQAVDLANMLLCLALRSSPQQVYQRALRHFSVEEISEAFAAARGLALPSQLRKLMRAQGRDLAAEFVRLLPEAPRPIGVQRWSTRRVTLLLVVALVLLPAAVPLAWLFARSSANPGGAAVVAGGTGGCTQIEELWLQAQAVPSASHIPCVQALPANVISAVAVRDGESVLELGHASLDISLIAGEWPRARAVAGSVTIRLTPTCAAATTGEGQTVAPGVKRFQLQGPVSTPQVVDVFPGGCFTYRPGSDLGSSASVAGSG